MKKLLTALGYVGIVVILIVVVAFIFLLVHGPELDRESKLYAESAIPAIFKSWDKQQLVNRASPEFMRVVPPDETDRSFNALSRLGHMTHCDPVKADSNMLLTPATGFRVTAVCITHATFQNGSAALRLILIKHGNNWQILRYDVRSPQPLPR